MPFADTSLYPLPPTGHGRVGARCWPTSCPTAYEVGVLNGQVRPGDTVAIVGAGPIGLAAITTARLFSPSHIVAIDPAEAGWTRPRSSVPTSPCIRATRRRASCAS